MRASGMMCSSLRILVNKLGPQGPRPRSTLFLLRDDLSTSNSYSTSAPMGSLKEANGDTGKKSPGVKLATSSPPDANPQVSDYAVVMQEAMKSHKVPLTYPGEVGMVDTDVHAAAAKAGRKVVIYKPTASANSQGGRSVANESVPHWTLDFGSTQRVESNLMGWTASADALAQVGKPAMQFYNQQQAIVYCEKMGLSYEVVQPSLPRASRQHRFAGYGDNFSVKRGGQPDLSTLPSNSSASD